MKPKLTNLYKIFTDAFVYKAGDRDLLPDFLKGIAVIFMIQVHIAELFLYNGFEYTYGGMISLFLGGPPAAPLFMMVMGFYAGRSKRPSGYFFRRGLLLIVGGILLNIALNFHLLIKISSGQILLDPYSYIFGADILPLAGFSLITIGVLRYFPRGIRMLIPFLILPVFYAASAIENTNCVEGEISSYLSAFFAGKCYWSYFPYFPWVIYPLMGFFVGQFRGNLDLFMTGQKYFKLLLLLLTSFVLIYLSPSVWSKLVELDSYYYHSLLPGLWIFSFLFIFIGIINKILNKIKPGKTVKFISWLGQNVTTVYVIQWVIIGNTATAIFRTQNEGEGAISFLIILLITVVFTGTYLALKKIKLLYA